jgi:hypothetical protein
MNPWQKRIGIRKLVNRKLRREAFARLELGVGDHLEVWKLEQQSGWEAV